jgi:hypothetical protein
MTESTTDTCESEFRLAVEAALTEGTPAERQELIRKAYRDYQRCMWATEPVPARVATESSRDFVDYTEPSDAENAVVHAARPELEAVDAGQYTCEELQGMYLDGQEELAQCWSDLPKGHVPKAACVTEALAVARIRAALKAQNCPIPSR